MDERQFRDAFEKSRIERGYESALPFGEIELPYILAIQHPRYSAKISISRGRIIIAPPIIYLPDDGLNLGDGFEDIGTIIDTIPYRRDGFQSVRVNHSGIPDSILHEGKMEDIIAREKERLDRMNDNTTGLLIGVAGFDSVAVIKYFCHLTIASRRSNVTQALRTIPPNSNYRNLN